MARARDAARDKAKEMYLASNGEMKIKDIAAELGKGEGTVRGWKNKDAWDDELNGTLQTNERNAPNEKSSSDSEATSVQGRKRSGNPNPPNQFSHRNNPKLLHGLYSKFLHKEQIEIVEAFEGLSIADKVWLQLELKFASIIRMQKIMWVNDAQDNLRATEMTGEGITKYKVAFAYERYEAFIKAQARAMAEYRNLADNFLKHSNQDDERRFKLEKMELDIARSHVALEKETGGGDEYEDDGFIDALKGVEVKWDD